MTEKEREELYQRVNSITVRLHHAETRQTEELFGEVMQLLHYMEHKIVTMANACSDMEQALNAFTDAYEMMKGAMQDD